MRRRLIGVFVLVWLMIGGYGVYAYSHDYYVYRGFGAPQRPPGVAAGTLKRIHFKSSALGARRAYDIYLPAGYAAAAARGQRFGVLYLLHGSPGTPSLFLNAGALGVSMDTLISHHSIRPFLIVMPDGGDGSLKGDTEWADTPHGRYDSFVLDVVHAVDRSWPTVADRAHRALAGNSMGAYAAANLALRHLSTFGAFEAWSGYYTQTPTGVFKHASAAQLAANSPAKLVRSLHGTISHEPLHAYLYSGADDPDTRQLKPFVRGLEAAGARVTARVLTGRHDWKLWRSQTPAMLRWAAEQIAGTP